VPRPQAGVLGRQLVAERKLGPIEALRKAEDLECICDVACCRRKGLGGFCDILVLASHWLFSMLQKLRKGLGIEDKSPGGALFADRSDI
jgi:hypothetical protein